MSRDSGYMSSNDDSNNIDLFKKLRDEIRKIEELRKAQSSQPSFVDQTTGHNDDVPPLPGSGLPFRTSPEILPTHDTSDRRIPNSPPLLPLPGHPTFMSVSGSTTPIRASQGCNKIKQTIPNSPPLLPLPRHPMSMPVSGSTTPIHRGTASQRCNQAASSASDTHKIKQMIPNSPPLLPLPRHPMSMPVSGSTTPIHRGTASQRCNQAASSASDTYKLKQTIPSSPLLPPPRYQSVSGSTTPIQRETAPRYYNQATSSASHGHRVKQTSPSSPPLLPIPRHPISMPVSGSTTPIHRGAASRCCNQATSSSTPDVHKIRQALLDHRKMTLMAPPPELLDMLNDPSPPSSPSKNVEETPSSPSKDVEETPLSPLKDVEETPSSPYDFRDLIEQYYEDLDETDTDEAMELSEEEMAAKNRKREAAVKEIVTTERTYVDGLNKCVEYFLKPLRDNGQKSSHRHTLLSTKSIVSFDEISSMFGNIEMILSLHQQLLRSLEERYSEWSPTGLICDIFLQNAPFLKMYTAYVRNFPRAIEITERLKKGNKDFRKFLQSSLGKSELGGLPFNSFLSLPIQRIPRYKLLLEALLKHTDESHPDYPNLENCVKQITIIADEVNEKIRDAENQNRVLEIQSKVEKCPIIVNPARRFIHEGDLFTCRYMEKRTSCLVSTSEAQTHYLFNDLLIYCSKSQGKIVYQEQIDLDYASIVNIENELSFCFKIVVKTPSGEKHHIVRALDEYTKLDWILKLEDAIWALKGSYPDGRKMIPIRQIPQSPLIPPTPPHFSFNVQSPLHSSMTISRN